MPIQLTYDPDLDAMVMHCTGEIVYSDLPVLAQQLISHPEFRKNINQVFDARQGALELSTEDLKQTAKDFQQISKIMGHSRKLALVVSRDVDYGMMRMYEVLFQPQEGVEIMSFRSLEKAVKWIGA